MGKKVVLRSRNWNSILKLNIITFFLIIICAKFCLTILSFLLVYRNIMYAKSIIFMIKSLTIFWPKANKFWDHLTAYILIIVMMILIVCVYIGISCSSTDSKTKGCQGEPNSFGSWIYHHELIILFKGYFFHMDHIPNYLKRALCPHKGYCASAKFLKLHILSV